MPGIDITPSEIRIRLKDPKRYKKFRYSNYIKPGLRFVYGITPDGKVEIQSLRFDRDQWTEKQAEKWTLEHFGNVIKGGKKNIGKLVPKKISVVRNGKQYLMTVWVRPYHYTPINPDRLRKFAEKWEMRRVKCESEEELSALEEIFSDFKKVFPHFSGFGKLQIVVMGIKEILQEYHSSGWSKEPEKMPKKLWLVENSEFRNWGEYGKGEHCEIYLGVTAGQNFFHEYSHFLYSQREYSWFKPVWNDVVKLFNNFMTYLNKQGWLKKILQRLEADIDSGYLDKEKAQYILQRAEAYVNDEDERMAFFLGRYWSWKAGYEEQYDPLFGKYFLIDEQTLKKFDEWLKTQSKK